MSARDPTSRPSSPGEASRRGLESLHDGREPDDTVLPEHGDHATPSPGEQHRTGPLPDEKK